MAGRASATLNALLGLDLTPVSQTTAATDLETVQHRASRIVKAYKEGALARSAEIKPLKTDSELKKEYAGKIIPGIQANTAVSSYRSMFNLLAEWFPLGKTIDELETIVGNDGTVSNNTVTYTFETGYYGMEFRFVLDGERISNVVVYGLD